MTNPATAASRRKKLKTPKASSFFPSCIRLLYTMAPPMDRPNTKKVARRKRGEMKPMAARPSIPMP